MLFKKGFINVGDFQKSWIIVSKWWPLFWEYLEPCFSVELCVFKLDYDIQHLHYFD